jgi:hypothetical protein
VHIISQCPGQTASISQSVAKAPDSARLPPDRLATAIRPASIHPAHPWPTTAQPSPALPSCHLLQQRSLRHHRHRHHLHCLPPTESVACACLFVSPPPLQLALGAAGRPDPTAAAAAAAKRMPEHQQHAGRPGHAPPPRPQYTAAGRTSAPCTTQRVCSAHHHHQQERCCLYQQSPPSWSRQEAGAHRGPPHRPPLPRTSGLPSWKLMAARSSGLLRTGGPKGGVSPSTAPKLLLATCSATATCCRAAAEVPATLATSSASSPEGAAVQWHCRHGGGARSGGQAPPLAPPAARLRRQGLAAECSGTTQMCCQVWRLSCWPRVGSPTGGWPASPA